MERRRISGHAPMEAIVGYSRAVVAGPHVQVSGTAPIPADGSDPPDSPYEQARLCLDIVLGALERAGATAADVVRTRVYVVPGVDFEGVGRAHAEVFGDVRPATTAVVVAALLDPRWLVEIEVEALIG
jgi:enamine deaminase RidA (YjgF/YER057c/UK114 family)